MPPSSRLSSTLQDLPSPCKPHCSSLLSRHPHPSACCRAAAQCARRPLTCQTSTLRLQAPHRGPAQGSRDARPRARLAAELHAHPRARPSWAGTPSTARPACWTRCRATSRSLSQQPAHQQLLAGPSLAASHRCACARRSTASCIACASHGDRVRTHRPHTAGIKCKWAGLHLSNTCLQDAEPAAEARPGRASASSLDAAAAHRSKKASSGSLEMGTLAGSSPPAQRSEPSRQPGELGCSIRG